MRRRAWARASASARCRATRSRTCRAIRPIGGTAKGHLVREIDALGGLMGRAIDATGMQFKLLNRSRGPAVWSPRAQADKKIYGAWVRRGARGRAEHRLDRSGGRGGSSSSTAGCAASRFEDGDAFGCRALVVTTGTFLNGLIHIGPEQHPAGRAGEPPSRELAESLKALGFEWGRLKTGTPPRLDRASIDFERQVADGRVHRASAATTRRCRSRSRPAQSSGRRSTATCSTRTTACAISSARTSIARRCSTGRSRGSGRATARRSRTRSSASPTRSATRSSWSRKAPTRARST